MLKVIHTFLFIILFTSKTLATEPIQVSTAFEPKELSLGKRGLLTLSVAGIKHTTPPTLPEIDGLIIRPLGTQQNLQTINGKISTNLTYSFIVIPQRAGEFTLPNFDWDINGKKYSVSSPTTKLTVSADLKEDKEEVTFMELKVDINKDKVFVGQMIPVTIFLYAPIHISASIDSLPKFEGNNFMSYDYKENPKPTIESIENIQKQVVPFKTYISPLKSGIHPLQYKMNLIIQRPRTVNQNRTSSNNIFDSIFGNTMITNTEEIEPTSIPLIIDVAPLPIHGKPENFSGAIGEFSVEPLSVSHTEAQVGDPITLKMTIKGSGNMDRISPPILNTEINWKTYPPKSTLNKEDDFGFTGTKAFEYIIIPQNEKITETPTITFSFFNPQTGRYSELTPTPVALKIIPATQSHVQSNAPHSMIKQTTLGLSSTEPELLPIKLEIKHSTKTLTPLISKMFFTPSLLGITLGLCTLLILIKKQKLKHNKDSAYLKQINTERAIRVNLLKAEKAYSKHNAEEFYHAASSVILEIVAKQHPKTSQTLDLNDVLNFLNEKGLSKESISYIKTIFHTRDMLKFSGIGNQHALTKENLNNFESLINELEKCC